MRVWWRAQTSLGLGDDVGGLVSTTLIHLGPYLPCFLFVPTALTPQLRRAGDPPRPDEPWTGVSKDTIQVTTFPGGAYIGDVDANIAEVLIPMLNRGLCRLEGFAMRLRRDGVSGRRLTQLTAAYVRGPH